MVIFHCYVSSPEGTYYLPFKKTQVQDYMDSFGEKIEPKERVMEAQIPSAYVEENNAKEIVVLVLGQTGGGSTQIDGMLKFLLGINWEEGIRFKVVDELQTVRSVSLARTVCQEPPVWCCHTRSQRFPVKGSPVCRAVSSLLTPQAKPGDTWGLHFDGKIVDQMKNFFNMSQHVNSLTGVCLVIPASAARLTESRKYVWNATLSLFGKDIAWQMAFQWRRTSSSTIWLCL